MKLGFLTGRLADIEKAARFGFDAVELQAGALGAPAAGPLASDTLDEATRLCRTHGVEISALAYYDLAWAAPPEGEIAATYGRVFDGMERLGVQTLASMSGFDAARDWDANIALWAERFGPVAEDAARRGLRVAFENWMSVGGGPLPFRPINLGGAPDTWDAMFAALPSPALGIEFDPSHLYWQGIDHMRALREYAPRIFHVHAKDTEMLPERRYRGGLNGGYFRFRIPGYGEINWTQFIAAVQEIGYDGAIAIEHEDPVYEGARFDEGLVRGWQTLHPLIHPRAAREGRAQ